MWGGDLGGEEWNSGIVKWALVLGRLECSVNTTGTVTLGRYLFSECLVTRVAVAQALNALG